VCVYVCVCVVVFVIVCVCMFVCVMMTGDLNKSKQSGRQVDCI